MRRHRAFPSELFSGILLVTALQLTGCDSRQEESGTAAQPSPETPVFMPDRVVTPSPQPPQAPASVVPSQGGPLQKGVEPSEAKRTLEVRTARDSVDFEDRVLTVEAGEVVRLMFYNRSNPALDRLHSWVLVKPGKEDEVGTSAIQAGPQENFLPESPDILAHTQLVEAGEYDSIVFRAPSEPGDYPYICIYPEHYHDMHGVLRVVAPEE